MPDRVQALVGAGGCAFAVLESFKFLLKMLGHPVNDFIQRGRGPKTGQSEQFVDAGNPPNNVFKFRIISLVKGNILEGGGTGGAFLHSKRQVFDGNFLGVAHIHDFADGTFGVHEANQSFDRVANVAETAGLLAGAVNGDRRILQSGLDEIRQHHAVASGLAWTYGIKKARNNNGQLLFLPVRKREEFVECFGRGIAPTAFRGRTEDEIGIFAKRNVGAFAVDFGRGSGEDKLFFLASGFENQLRAVDVRFNGPDRAFHNELDAHGSGQMNDHIGIVDELREQLPVFDVIQVVPEVRARLEMADVLDAASGKIVEQDDAVAWV